MFGVVDEISIVEEVRDEKVEKMIEYIRSLNTIEEAMEPYKEQKRELRKEYKEQEWLTKDEISMAVKAYRMMKSEVDIDQFVSVYESVKKITGGGD
jgi:phosphatidate phosphatase APP1|tara:strand:- start:1222 stop:1509 length:288 start_codon:yes stop_codon:yes gene_type:complete